MKVRPAGDVSTQSPYLTLIYAFLGWKILLLSIAILSPGLGYDTSTDLLFEHATTAVSKHIARDGQTGEASWTQHIASKFVRWDAIYFVTSAQRGYVYEQEWAFGWGLSKLIGFVSGVLLGSLPALLPQSLAAILIANASHLASVLLLHQLCETIDTRSRYGVRSEVVAALHVLAPAGIILSAPYGESLFSALSLAGYLCYAKSDMPSGDADPRPTSRSHMYVLLSGALFGLSCLVRSNGLFNGVILAVDLIRSFPTLFSSHYRSAIFGQMAALTVAGLLIASGFVYPQYIAWKQYCGAGVALIDRREWCEALIPSVYTFVQSHYWNVGLLRYWTLSNIPLFALAAPMLMINARSAVWCFEVESSEASVYLRRLALPQLMITVLAVTNFHVQVITRISSCFPLIYLWTGALISSDNISHWVTARLVTTWMVMYGLVQAGLFASFLPPA